MIVASQSFRVTGKQDVQDIICDNVNGQNVVFWDDITHVFPGVTHVKIGNSVVNMMRDSNQQRIQPWCIKHFPGVVLDVLVSTSSPAGAATSYSSSLPVSDPINTTSTAAHNMQTEDKSTTPLSTTTTANEATANSAMSTPNRPDPEPSTGLTINATIPSDHAAKHASVSTPESDVNEQLSTLQDKQTQIRSLLDSCHSLALAIWNGKAEKSDQLNDLYMRYLEGLKSSTAQLTELQKALEDTDTYDLGQLALLQRQIQTALSQNHKIYEDPAPRLFIVLPQHIQRWNSEDPLSNKFQLYFLCDCGEHTKLARSMIPHHIHFAKHEGYDISRPKEFFRKYGTHVLTIMKMLKFGISSAGVTVPPVSQLINMDIVGRDAESLEGEMDQVIDCIEKITMDEEETTVDHTARWMGYESMVPTQLRLLDVFLRRGDDEQFGNLFRTVNAEGYVRWVCVDHFRGIHHEKEAEALRATLKSLGRSFDENVGRVEVMLCSREEANQFYQGLERVVSVYELEIQLYWDVTPDDLKRLRDTLAKTNVSMLNLEIDVHDDSTTDSSKDTSDGAQLCGAILDLMRHATIQSFTMIEVPKEFFENISLLSHHADLSNLKVLDIGQELYEVDQGLYDTDPEAWDSPGLKKLLSKATNLSSLTLREAEDDTPQIYSAIAKYQTYPIYLQDRLRILPPTDEGRCRCGQPMDTIEDMEDLLKGYGGRIEMLDMYYKEDLDESTLKAFAKSISRGSCLEDLRLAEIDPSVWESCGTHLANIVSRSKLRKLVARFGGGGEAGLQLLESIQWDHIRTLGIRMDQVSLGAMAMELLLDGIGSRSGRVALQDFRLFSDCTKQVSDQLLGLLQSFLGSMPPLMDLDLGVTLTLDQICTLLKSTDLSEVLYLGVRAKDFDETKVGVILDTLEHATQLRKVSLYGAKRAENQSKRLSAKGILLSDQ